MKKVLNMINQKMGMVYMTNSKYNPQHKSSKIEQILWINTKKWLRMLKK